MGTTNAHRRPGRQTTPTATSAVQKPHRRVVDDGSLTAPGSSVTLARINYETHKN